jgi:cytochrome c oxidase assembly protein subunit 15
MRALHRASAVALGLTFVLILLGAWVRATGSGLSCPDWPTCYGHWLPLPGEIPQDAGYSYLQVMLEWLHRLLAGVILGPLVLVIAALAWRARAISPRMPAYGLTLLLLLLVQASLGGLTVLDQNSPWSVALHLMTALVLFSVLWLIFARSGGAGQGSPAARPLAVLTWLLALATMASAALMTKSGASLACASWPLCDGALVPDLADPLVHLNLAHRLLAAATAAGALLLFLRLRTAPALARLAHAVLAMIVLEVALGGLVVLIGLPLWSGLVHQAFGVLTFGLLSLLMWRALAPVPEPAKGAVHVGLSRA